MVSNRHHDKAECPPDLAIIDSISGKWTALIVYILSDKPRRNGELKKAVTGISHKVLTQTLRRLERDGIVNRKVYPVVPPQVEYSLTLLGKSVVDLLSNMCHWAKSHYPEVKKARIQYDSHSRRKQQNNQYSTNASLSVPNPTIDVT